MIKYYIFASIVKQQNLVFEITTTTTCGYCAIGCEQTGCLFNVECLQCAVTLSLMFLYIKYFPRKEHILLIVLDSELADVL